MSHAEFESYLGCGIKSAQSQIYSETVKHEKRMEFWAGYKAAMEEVLGHPEFWPCELNKERQ